MQELGSVNQRPAGLPAEVQRTASTTTQRGRSAEVGVNDGDQVELSAAAMDYDLETEAARALQQRIDDIRAQIADDTYLTPEKLDVVVERLHEEVFGH